MTKNNVFLAVAALIIVAIVAVVLLNRDVDKVESDPVNEETTQIAPNEPATAETNATLTIEEDESEEASVEVADPEPATPAAQNDAQ